MNARTVNFHFYTSGPFSHARLHMSNWQKDIILQHGLMVESTDTIISNANTSVSKYRSSVTLGKVENINLDLQILTKAIVQSTQLTDGWVFLPSVFPSLSALSFIIQASTGFFLGSFPTPTWWNHKKSKYKGKLNPKFYVIKLIRLQIEVLKITQP